ncbi:hypothetical protein I5H09_gp018 [Mycobacterium phage Yunkel11]|uniref:Uncharacterized protein n=1 Tax=Mycobacterium phage Yunkel11 TaxID=2599886 RepID=A0A5J6TC14_9CAUD|nr:hypothetical protein I5H09_gp018 [Mycobacterium phage Yunkel11]QFG08473.1 hypothetical protein SEA_YUNKEL11_88 [Mycobacterium phage Yunkel11]
MAVHNHGTEDGPGLACRERLVDGKLRGACLDDRPKMHGFAMMRSDSTGTRYWRRGADGDAVEITRGEWLRLTWVPGEPIYNQVLDDLGACRNCGCADCGCCVGCGQVDADLFGSHGYACVM